MIITCMVHCVSVKDISSSLRSLLRPFMTHFFLERWLFHPYLMMGDKYIFCLSSVYTTIIEQKDITVTRLYMPLIYSTTAQFNMQSYWRLDIATNAFMTVTVELVSVALSFGVD